MRNDAFPAAQAEALEARLALRLTARLTIGTAELPLDVTERLRYAREQALLQARKAETRTSPVQAASANGPGTLAWRSLGGGSSWLGRSAAVLPLMALIAGLLLIQHRHVQSQISAAAEIDVSLLADDVPPSAYSDPGFVEFLKTPHE